MTVFGDSLNSLDSNPLTVGDKTGIEKLDGGGVRLKHLKLNLCCFVGALSDIDENAVRSSREP